MPSPTVDRELGEWLQPATVELSPAQYRRWRQAVTAMSGDLNEERVMKLVAAAHGEIDDDLQQWINAHLRKRAPGFASKGKKLLLTILAAAAAIEVLEDSKHRMRKFTTVLVESAAFAFAQPQVSSLNRVAAEVLGSLRRDVRRRPKFGKTLKAEIGQIIAKGGSVDPAGATWTAVIAVYSAHEAGLRIMADRIGDMFSNVSELLELQDEELNVLWWSFGGISTLDSKPWNAIKSDARIAVLVAIELHRLLTRIPGPSSARGILSRALGERADSTTTIASVSEVLAEFTEELEGLPSHRLFPMTAAARTCVAIGNDDESWKVVVEKTFGFDPNSPVSLLAAAEQVMTELDSRALYLDG